jgi:hypothetical protein
VWPVVVACCRSATSCLCDNQSPSRALLAVSAQSLCMYHSVCIIKCCCVVMCVCHHVITSRARVGRHPHSGPVPCVYICMCVEAGGKWFRSWLHHVLQSVARLDQCAANVAGAPLSLVRYGMFHGTVYSTRERREKCWLNMPPWFVRTIFHWHVPLGHA